MAKHAGRRCTRIKAPDPFKRSPPHGLQVLDTSSQDRRCAPGLLRQHRPASSAIEAAPSRGKGAACHGILGFFPLFDISQGIVPEATLTLTRQMHVIANTAILLVTTAAMEGIAWLSHRYLMHGPGWGWHASHHEPRTQLLEKNDLFAVCFAAFAIVLIWFGTSGAWPLQWIGAGMTLYGLLYFVVHDGMVHRRWPLNFVPARGYLRRLYQAHLLHHATSKKDGAVSFGFLIAPSERHLRTALDARRAQRKTGSSVRPDARRSR